MEQTAIQKLAVQSQALANLTSQDLADMEKARGLIRVAHEVSTAEKEYKALKDTIYGTVKGICAEELEGHKAVTVYDYEQALKFTVSKSGGGIILDENDLWQAIADKLKVPVDVHEGKAWEFFESLTDPVQQVPRVINQARLSEYLKTNPKFQSVVDSCKQEVASVVKAQVAKMSKAEVEANVRGDLTAIKVVS